MLGKLLKYDLKDVYKVLIVFYIIAILCAVFTRIFFSVDNSTIFNVLGYITSGTLISMFFNIVINNVMRIWSRFRKNVYGDEAYLTHTLPVSKKDIYLSKFLSSGIALFSSFLVMVVCAFMAYYSKENMEIVKEFFKLVSSVYDGDVIKIIIYMFGVLFLELLFMIQCGYFGMLVGHKMNNNKILMSILFGFIYYVVFQVITFIIIFVFGLIDKDIMNLFIGGDSLSFGIIEKIVLISAILYSLYVTISYFVSIKIFKKGIDVE